MIFRDCQGKPTRNMWHSCLAMLYSITFSNTAKYGYVLSSNLTKSEAEIKNSYAKLSVFQLLNFTLIIHIRYSCSVHLSESITVYLGKQIILHLPTTGLWHLFLQHMVLWAAIVDHVLGPKDRSRVKLKFWEDVQKIKKCFLAWQILLQEFLCKIFLRWSVITVFTPNGFEYTQIFFFPTMKATVASTFCSGASFYWTAHLVAECLVYVNCFQWILSMFKNKNHLHVCFLVELIENAHLSV